MTDTDDLLARTDKKANQVRRLLRNSVDPYPYNAAKLRLYRQVLRIIAAGETVDPALLAVTALKAEDLTEAVSITPREN